jgi:hypothetical protein
MACISAVKQYGWPAARSNEKLGDQRWFRCLDLRVLLKDRPNPVTKLKGSQMSALKRIRQRSSAARVKFLRSGRTTEIVLEGTITVVVVGILALAYIAHLLH